MRVSWKFQNFAVWKWEMNYQLNPMWWNVVYWTSTLTLKRDHTGHVGIRTEVHVTSFGQTPPTELVKYLTPNFIHRSAVIVQHDQAEECGSLCLYVLKMLSVGVKFSQTLESLLQRYRLSPTPPLSIMVWRQLTQSNSVGKDVGIW